MITGEELLNICEDTPCLFYGEPALLHFDARNYLYLLHNYKCWLGAEPYDFGKFSSEYKNSWVLCFNHSYGRTDFRKPILDNIEMYVDKDCIRL